MAKIELGYTEIDGLLYPNIETGMEHIEGDLGKYGILRLRYLYEHKREMYRTLLLTGKLALHCKAVDIAAFEQSEQIQAAWLDTHPMPLEDTLERVRLRTQAQMIADEIVTAELVYV
ncbi:MAG: TnpV protein [Lachnospiraceae bacterium]|nr:TnpV protein [Lachnospiraceae bacterium]